MRLSIALILTALSGLACAQDGDPLTNGPDYSKDRFPPYPPLTNADGSNITLENLRGTRLFGWKGCEVLDAQAIAAAFDDMNKLATPLASQIDWKDEVAEDFWGKGDGVNRVPDERRAAIQHIFQAQQQMYYNKWQPIPPWWFWKSLWIEVRCSGGDGTGDPENTCKDEKPNNGQCSRGGSPTSDDGANTLQAYTDNVSADPDKLTYSRITFCKGFFQLQSLSNAMSIAIKLPKAERNKLYNWDNQARVFTHEATHLDYFMDAPKMTPFIDDLVFDYTTKIDGKTQKERATGYGPYFAKMLRNVGEKDGVGFYPQRNADSYAWFAVGSYIKQQTKSYPRAPRPLNKPAKGIMNSYGEVIDGPWTVSTQSEGPPPEDMLADATDDVPDYPPGYSTPGCTDTDIRVRGVDSNKTPPTGDPTGGPTGDKNACHGVSGDYWVMSRDVAVENIQDFCGQVEHTKKYNVGSVNELELSVKKLDDETKRPTDSPDCINRFQKGVIDGCDGDDATNNPHNYKFGSTLTTTDGWEYKMTPLSKQVNEVSCDVSYKFFFDGFEIRGKNWADAGLGPDGKGLQAQLSGCGALTNWKFERTPNDCCFQWFASGQLPIGTKDCIGRAVKTTGGSSEGNCHGAGKRAVARHNSIDTWPGYGDESRHVFHVALPEDPTWDKNGTRNGTMYRRGFRHGQRRRAYP